MVGSGVKASSHCNYFPIFGFMNILSKWNKLFKKQPLEDEQTLTELLKDSDPKKKQLPISPLIKQVIDKTKETVDGPQVYPCADPEFNCEYRRDYMPLFEKDEVYIKVAFDDERKVTHVCGLLSRFQREQRKKGKVEQNNFPSMQDCQVSQAIIEVLNPGERIASIAAGKITKEINFPSMLVLDDGYHGLLKSEQEWLNTTLYTLRNNECDILDRLLKYSIRAKNFKETLEIFLSTKKELQPGSCNSVIESFKSLAREFPIEGEKLSVAHIGLYLEQTQNIEKDELFRVILELFFCMGYDKYVMGYATGFTDK